ncbi:hypothetical protein V1477_001007, partial [Vespula maculifrons]
MHCALISLGMSGMAIYVIAVLLISYYLHLNNFNLLHELSLSLSSSLSSLTNANYSCGQHAQFGEKYHCQTL